MNEEYSFRSEYEFRNEYPPPPAEYGAAVKSGKSKKKLARFIVFSWATLLLGGGALSAAGGDVQCDITVYDIAGNIVVEETVSESAIEKLSVPNGTYSLSDGEAGLTVTEGCLSREVSDSVSPSDDGIKHITLYPSA